ncbi:hypothetical protein ABPG72_006081 [Tetrahymena utriculariae]
MTDQINCLSVVLKNMQAKRLISFNEVDSITDGAMRGNDKIIGILQDFFNESQQQQQEIEVLEKKILNFLKEQDAQSIQSNQKQNDLNCSEENEKSQESPSKSSNQIPQKKGEEVNGNSQQQNNNSSNLAEKKSNHISFGHFFSNKSQNSDSQKIISSFTLQKQQALQYLKSIVEIRQKNSSAGEKQSNQKQNEDFDLLCEDLLMHLLSPDKSDYNQAEQEITQLLTQKKNQIKEKIFASSKSLLKASIINCEMYQIVRYTKEILKNLFGICEFEVTKIHNSSINSFSSKNVIQQTGEAKNEEELKKQFNKYVPNKVFLLNEAQKKDLENLFSFDKNKEYLMILKSQEDDVYILVFHVNQHQKGDSFFSILENNFDNSFHNLFKDQIISLLCIFVRDKDYLQKKYLHKLVKLIEEYIKKSELILIEDIRICFQQYFEIPAQIIFGWEQLQQVNQNNQVQQEDSCKYEISIPIAKITLKCQLTKAHYSKLLQLQIFEKVMTAIYSDHHQKIKTLLSKFTNYMYFLRNGEIVLMDFNNKGYLIFISQTLNPATIEKLRIKIADSSESVDPSFYFNYLDIFQNNQHVKTLIQEIRNDPEKFSIRSEGDPHVEIIINPSSKNEGPRGFKIFLKQEDFHTLNTISIQQPSLNLKEKHLPQVSKIKRAMHKLSFITRTSKTAMSKDMVLKDPDVKNSWVREYLPDRDLQKIQEDENQKQDGNQNRSNLPRLFNPQTTINRISDVLLTSQNISKPQPQDLIKKEQEDSLLDQFKFDIFKADQKEKVRIIWSIFQKRNYFDKYKIPLSQFCEFIQEIRLRYNKRGNPFHNFDHGITVMHGCYMLCCQTVAQTIIKDINEFALIFSGLCHDVSHTARTNVFEVNSMSKLAIRYHDKSVLEQHHIAVTFKILRKKEANILTQLPLEQVQQIRKIVISNILATDIKQHFDLLKDFELRFGSKGLKLKNDFQNNAECQSTTTYSDNDLNLITNMMIHAADFHGNAQEFELSKKWSLLVNQEFQAQYKEEGEKNIPQTPYLKDLDKRDILAKSEIGFINAIVKPLWELLNKFLGDDLQISTKNLSNNIKQWDQINKECSNQEPSQKQNNIDKTVANNSNNKNNEDKKDEKHSPSNLSQNGEQHKIQESSPQVHNPLLNNLSKIEKKSLFRQITEESLKPQSEQEQNQQQSVEDQQQNVEQAQTKNQQNEQINQNQIEQKNQNSEEK